GEGAAFGVDIQWVTSAGGQTKVVLTSNGAGIVGGSLADGHYTLTIDGSKITDSLGQAVDADGDGFAGGVRTDSFHRLFGDVNGDDAIDSSDVVYSAHHNGTHLGDTDYLWWLDYDGDGTINGQDHREVAHRQH